MLVYRSQGQDIEDNDVIEYKGLYYVVRYMMEATTFVLYPLGWHTIAKLSWDTLDSDPDWTYLWHIHDSEVYDQIPKLAWPHDNQRDNIIFYLTQNK